MQQSRGTPREQGVGRELRGGATSTNNANNANVKKKPANLMLNELDQGLGDLEKFVKRGVPKRVPRGQMMPETPMFKA